MYFARGEHNPPHIHGYYQDSKIIIGIYECEVLGGQIPARQLRLIQAWIEIHRDELLADWELCQNGEKPFRIDPLK
jgi:hypothetical protein